MSTRSAAHYASWAASWANMNIPRMLPTAIPLTTAGLATPALPFAHGLRSAHTSTFASLTALDREDNLGLNQHPLPPTAPKDPALPEPTEIGQRQPHAQNRFAAIPQCARRLDDFDQATPAAAAAHRAIMISSCHSPIRGPCLPSMPCPTSAMAPCCLPPLWMLCSSTSAFPCHSRQVPPHVSVEQPWTDMATTSRHA